MFYPRHLHNQAVEHCGFDRMNNYSSQTRSLFVRVRNYKERCGETLEPILCT